MSVAAAKTPYANADEIHPMSSHCSELDSGTLGRYPW